MDEDYILAYQNDVKVKEYVDKYCVKHGKTLNDALKDYIVREYIREVKKRQNEHELL